MKKTASLRWIMKIWPRAKKNLSSSQSLQGYASQYCYIRPLREQLLQRINEPSRKIIMIWGARQSGKSTLIKQTLSNYDGYAHYINFDDFDREEALSEFPKIRKIAKLFPDDIKSSWMRHHWKKARRIGKKNDKRSLLVIDEIQLLDNWSQKVKGAWDMDYFHDENIQIILLGSSPHLLQKGLSESLLGRYKNFRSPHWSYTEMSAAFGLSLDEYIFYGGYPGGAEYIDQASDKRWREYIHSSVVTNNLKRDVFHYIHIEEPEVLKALYDTASKQSGRIIGLDKIRKPLQGGKQVVFLRYLEVLSHVFLLTALPLYRGEEELTDQLGTKVKFQVYNTALTTIRYHHSLSEMKEKPQNTLWGRFVESAVGAHLLNTSAFDDVIYYWRNDKAEPHHEVDFVIRSDGGTTAIEVKSGRIDRPRKSGEGLRAFARTFPHVSRCLLVGDGGDVSLEEFFSQPATHWCQNRSTSTGY